MCRISRYSEYFFIFDFLYEKVNRNQVKKYLVRVAYERLRNLFRNFLFLPELIIQDLRIPLQRAQYEHFLCIQELPPTTLLFSATNFPPPTFVLQFFDLILSELVIRIFSTYSLLILLLNGIFIMRSDVLDYIGECDKEEYTVPVHSGSCEQNTHSEY